MKVTMTSQDVGAVVTTAAEVIEARVPYKLPDRTLAVGTVEILEKATTLARAAAGGAVPEGATVSRRTGMGTALIAAVAALVGLGVGRGLRDRR